MRTHILAILFAIFFAEGCSRTPETTSQETVDLMEEVLQDLEQHQTSEIKDHRQRQPSVESANGLAEMSQPEPDIIQTAAVEVLDTSGVVTAGHHDFQAHQSNSVADVRFHVGDAFPVIQSTQQVLRQAAGTQSDHSITMATTWQLLFSIVDIQNEVVFGKLHFQRVAAEYSFSGQRFQFDSANGTPTTDANFAEVQALIGCELTFQWVPGSQMPAVTNPNALLSAFAAKLRPDQQAVLDAIAAKIQSKGLAAFLDPSIWLLPSSAAHLQTGTTWVRQFPETDGIATTTARLDALAESQLTVSVAGQYPPQQVSNAMSILEGKQRGSGTFDANTGLPIQFQRSSLTKLQIQQPNGPPIMRQKQITVTVRTLANQNSLNTGASTPNNFATTQPRLAQPSVQQSPPYGNAQYNSSQYNTGQMNHASSVQVAPMSRDQTDDSETLSSSAVAHYPE